MDWFRYKIAIPELLVPADRETSDKTGHETRHKACHKTRPKAGPKPAMKRPREMALEPIKTAADLVIGNRHFLPYLCDYVQ